MTSIASTTSTLRICLLQLSVVPYNFEANRRKIKKYMEKVMSLPSHQKPNIMVLPEMWNIGFTIHKVDRYSDKEAHQTQEFLSALAKEYHVFIIGGSVATYFPALNQYQNFNMNIDQEGKVISTYSKVHLFSPSQESTIFTPGHQFSLTSITFPFHLHQDHEQWISQTTTKTIFTRSTPITAHSTSNSIPTVLTPTSKLSIPTTTSITSPSEIEWIFSNVICYDIRFPEYIRSISLAGIDLKKERERQKSKKIEKTHSSDSSFTHQNQNSNQKKSFEKIQGGLDILFVSAAWPYPRLAHWRNLLIARAIENQCYVIAVNNCGEMDGLTFCGHSLVIDPWGEILVEGHGPQDNSLSFSFSGEQSNVLPSSSTLPLIYDEIIEDESEYKKEVGKHKAFDEILMASISYDVLSDIRQRICVFNDRCPDIYYCN